VRADNGVEVPLMDVMTKTIKHIKEEALLKLKGILGDILDEQRVSWVITVPAIWTDFAKHFMRCAAFKAGMIDTEDDLRLTLALEPEAAVASCIHDMNPVLKLPNMTKFIMLDCGGGTIDITSHIIASGGIDEKAAAVSTNTIEPLALNELVAPRGGDWGSMRVDENFIARVIKPLLGEQLYEKFEQSHDCKHQLLEDFEVKVKKTHNPAKTKGVRLNIAALESLFEGFSFSFCLSVSFLNR
jgi:hypothetical protein